MISPRFYTNSTTGFPPVPEHDDTDSIFEPILRDARRLSHVSVLRSWMSSLLDLAV
jgi:hypothetical protein